jgi:hypothetical protein
LAEVAHDQGNTGRAAVLIEQSMTLYRELGGTALGITMPLSISGTITQAQGDTERARVLLEESLALQREVGSKWDMATTLNRLGRVTHAQGDDGRAMALYEESMTLCRELGDKHGLAECLEGLAEVAVAQRQLERTAWLLGAAESLRTATGAPLSPCERVRYDRGVSTVRAGLGEAAFAVAWTTGKAMPQEQVIHTAGDKRSGHHDRMGA